MMKAAKWFSDVVGAMWSGMSKRDGLSPLVAAAGGGTADVCSDPKTCTDPGSSPGDVAVVAGEEQACSDPKTCTDPTPSLANAA